MIASNTTRLLSGSKYRYGIRPLEVGGKDSRETVVEFEREWKTEGVTDAEYE